MDGKDSDPEGVTNLLKLVKTGTRPVSTVLN